jgi:speckle-type POZ protein
METVTAAHNFEVRDYPLLQGVGVSNAVSSSVFRVGGYDWKIEFYPDGLANGKSSYAGCFLNCVSPANDVRALFSLNMLKKLNGEEQVTHYDGIEHTFPPGGTAWGYRKFVPKWKLISLLDVNNGCFTIRCVVTVIHQPRTVRRRKLILATQPTLRESLEHMLKAGEGADVTFSVGDQLFNARRCVLAARSPVFKAELIGPMKEAATRCIKVDDMEPEILEALLHFIYTDDMLDDDDDEGKTDRLQHLLVAADRYGVDRLRAICEEKLYEGIAVETAATTLLLAEQQQCKDLKEACIEFMTSRDMLGPVMATNGFKQLVANCPLLMEDI